MKNVIEVSSATIAIIYMSIMMIFLFLDSRYRKKQKRLYKNDERWKLIVSKADNVQLKYYMIVTLIVFVVGALIKFIPENRLPTFNLDQILSFAFYILLLNNGIQYFSIKYFDKKI